MALRQVSEEPALADAARRMLHLLDEALDEAEQSGMRRIARTIPHELGQPLAEVRGYAELLVERDFTEEQLRDLLGRIARAATRLGELVHAIGAIAEEPVKPETTSLAGHDLVDVPLHHASALAKGAAAELRRSALTRLDIPPPRSA